MDHLPPSLARIVRTEARAAHAILPAGVVSQEELEQFGHVGLLEARERFDPSRGVAFGAFARFRVRGAIYDGLRQIGALTRRSYERLRRAVIAHDAVGEPAPVPAEGPDPGQDAQVVYASIVRLAMARIADETLADAPADPEEAACDSETHARVRAAFQQLDDESQIVLRAVLDLGEEGDSGAALARRRGVSRSAVSRVHREALFRLKRLLESSS
ncbi:MAG: sigma-70 family RNA polymerase sigma factor [Myxococcales bacterium]|nr:sigma-70 family RNA polymerase sigma factor [Myxococcales bacterium]